MPLPDSEETLTSLYGMKLISPEDSFEDAHGNFRKMLEVAPSGYDSSRWCTTIYCRSAGRLSWNTRLYLTVVQ